MKHTAADNQNISERGRSMPRRINETKYGMSHRRYRMLVDFCYLYPEWQQWLQDHKDTIGSPVVDGLPHGKGSTGEPTADLAIKRAEIERNVRLVEETAKEAGGSFAKWLLLDVCNPEISFQQLKWKYNIPCGGKRYFELRKKYFILLNHKIS